MCLMQKFPAVIKIFISSVLSSDFVFCELYVSKLPSGYAVYSTTKERSILWLIVDYSKELYNKSLFE